MGIPASLVAVAADFMADHVFNRLDIQGWMARTGFQMLDPLKTAKARVDFLRQLHDREALLPREQQRRFLASEGWIAWSGPAISELLKQFIAHNRMMTGGFAINGQMVTLNDIACPVLAVIGEVDDIGQPASVRGIQRAAPGRRLRDDDPGRPFRSGRRVEGRAGDLADGRRMGQWVSGTGEQPRAQRRTDAARRDTPRQRRLVHARVVHGVGEASEVALSWRVGGRRRRRREQVHAHPCGRDDSDPAEADATRTDQRPHPNLVGADHLRAVGIRPTASSCSSTGACTPTRRSTAASTTSCGASSTSVCARASTWVS